jgi:hypothetical protein
MCRTFTYEGRGQGRTRSFVERHLKYKEGESIIFYKNTVTSKLVELVIDGRLIVVSTKVKKEAKQSLYRPGEALRVPEV